MRDINILDDVTINKIAAGEVVEKPMAVVKELVENSIDAKSSIITVEIKNGGLDFIRITDNGTGIPYNQIEKAFCRHATSKIETIDDLDTLASLGFRGEALASIASVAQVECITKTAEALTGIHYEINGGVEVSKKEIGCPTGTTFIIKNLFYNTPARRKFLKSPTTEGNYISDVIEKIAMSHPEVSFRYINNGKQKFVTNGNGRLKDVIFQIYGRDITSNIVEFTMENEFIKASGFIGKPVISKGNRTFMNYFVNGRYVKSPIIYRALEEGYDGFHMSHKYPFCVLLFDVNSEKVDVNVHPSKMEIRFSEGDRIYSVLLRAIRETLRNIDVIAMQSLKTKEEKLYEKKEEIVEKAVVNEKKYNPEPFEVNRIKSISMPENKQIIPVYESNTTQKPEQISLFERKEMVFEKAKDYKIIGCVFSTYWIIQFHDDMYIMDQHAAHEKVLYEKLVKKMSEHTIHMQQVSPPIVITLDAIEAGVVNDNYELFTAAGYEIEHFGGNEYLVSSVPSDLPGIASKEVLTDFICSLQKELAGKKSETVFLEKLASMSCKAAIKGGTQISALEAGKLVEDLFELDNPFNCPHGRPTIIKMTKNELEKRFGRQL